MYGQADLTSVQSPHCFIKLSKIKRKTRDSNPQPMFQGNCFRDSLLANSHTFHLSSACRECNRLCDHRYTSTLISLCRSKRRTRDSNPQPMFQGISFPARPLAIRLPSNKFWTPIFVFGHDVRFHPLLSSLLHQPFRQANVIGTHAVKHTTAERAADCQFIFQQHLAMRTSHVANVYYDLRIHVQTFHYLTVFIKAEGKGIEPLRQSRSTVFKTAAVANRLDLPLCFSVTLPTTVRIVTNRIVPGVWQHLCATPPPYSDLILFNV